MVTKILMLTSLLVQAYSVPVNSNEDDSIIPKGRYNFNHPPTVEEYNPITEAHIYSKDSDLSPRISRDVVDSVEKQEPETATDKISDDDITKIDLIPKELAVENERIPDDVTQTGLIKSNEDKPKGRRKSVVRKTKVQKKIIPQPAKNGFTQNVNIPKLSIIQTTTLKPTVTTHKLVNSPKSLGQIQSNKVMESRKRDPVVPIVESENYVYAHRGDFHYSYLSGDGTRASEQGELRVFDDKTAGEAVVGSFSYTDKDGNDFSLSYTADENGYRPVGDHLPTPPPIPPAIARALQYLSTKIPIESTTKI